MAAPSAEQRSVDVHFIAPAALIDRIKAIAQHNERTLSAELRIALREHAEREEQARKGAER